MNKLMVLFLVMLICFNLAACGSEKDRTEPDQTMNQAQSSDVSKEENVAPTQEAETTAPKTEPEAAFDTAWAANEFEALLPKLPFEGWTTTQESDTVYEMELGGLKDSVFTDENGITIGYDEDKEALMDYLESLKSYGFSVEETGGIEGYAYKWMVIDPSGNEIEFVCAEHYCWITITKKA